MKDDDTSIVVTTCTKEDNLAAMPQINVFDHQQDNKTQIYSTSLPINMQSLTQRNVAYLQ